jgi:hypothetical protein
MRTVQRPNACAVEAAAALVAVEALEVCRAEAPAIACSTW